jgi:hypothetical protein
MGNLFHLFKSLSRLKYLSIGILDIGYDILTIDQLHLTNNHAVHLKRLVIDEFRDEFNLLEILLQRTPNLKQLTISVTDNIEMIDACRWERLITVSLPCLNVFNFTFGVTFEDNDNDISDRFQLFQTEFWHQQHHWYTEWQLDKNTLLVYTTPYMLNEYIVTPYTKRYCNASMNSFMTFKNVTDLTLFIGAITDTCQYHFPNVQSLEIDNDRVDENHTYPFLKTKHVLSLKSIVNLWNLTHLDITWKCKIKSPSVVLHLLQEAPHISSLRIHKRTLFLWFNNRELCKYFNKMIKKLDIVISLHTFTDSFEIVKLFEVFSNIEQFRCIVNRQNNLLTILNELSKLSHMKIFSYYSPYFGCMRIWDHSSLVPPDSYSFEIRYEIGRFDEFETRYHGCIDNYDSVW